MYAISSNVSFLVTRLLSILGPGHLLLSLTVASVACGILFLWIFRRFSAQSALRDTKRKIQAHLLEFRLFNDDPLILWRSYRAIVTLNVRYMRLVVLPAAITAVPMLLLLAFLSPFYDSRPLHVGEPATVTVQMNQAVDPAAPLPVIAATDGIRIESPAIRVFEKNQVSWRVRPQAPFVGEIVIEIAGEKISKSFAAGNMVAPASGLRSDSLLSPLWNPSEPALASNAVESVSVQYPRGVTGPAGWGVHWVVWFTIVSLLTALLLRKKFRVAI
jgi:hypothetical protein